MKKEVIDIEVKGLDDAVNDVDKLNESVEVLDKNIKDTGDTAKKTGKDIGKGFKEGSKGVAKFKTAIKGVGLAIKAAGIGLLIAAITQFQDLFLGDSITNSLTVAAETINNIFKGQSFEIAFKNAQETLRLQKEIQINEKRLQKFQLEQQDLAEQQRQTRDDVSKSITERIQANKNLGVILERQLNAELELAKISLGFAASENEKLGTQESYLALLDAEIKIAEINERITSQRSEQKVNDIALQQELNLLKETESLIENQIFKIQELKGTALLDALQREAEREFEKEDLILANRLEHLEAGTQAYADTLLERQQIGDDYQIENARRELEREKILKNAKIQIALSTLTALQNFAEEGSNLAKGVAVAQALINTYQGITAELATKTVTPWEFGLKIANIAAVTAIGFKSVKDILKTDPSGSNVAGASSPSVSAPQAQAPTFNIVGSGGTNQLANVISQQTGQPIQAFVTSSSVTTAQALDRNIIDSASVG